MNGRGVSTWYTGPGVNYKLKFQKLHITFYVIFNLNKRLIKNYIVSYYV